MTKIIRKLEKWNGIDLTKVVYPVVIFLTGWYVIVSVYWLPMGREDPVYVIVWALVPAAFIYLAVKGVKLKFKWSVLSAIGIAMIFVFASSTCLELASPYFDLASFLLTGLWDHFLWPIAFGLFFLCDLHGLPTQSFHHLIKSLRGKQNC